MHMCIFYLVFVIYSYWKNNFIHQLLSLQVENRLLWFNFPLRHHLLTVLVNTRDQLTYSFVACPTSVFLVALTKLVFNSMVLLEQFSSYRVVCFEMTQIVEIKDLFQWTQRSWWGRNCARLKMRGCNNDPSGGSTLSSIFSVKGKMLCKVTVQMWVQKWKLGDKEYCYASRWLKIWYVHIGGVWKWQEVKKG